MYLSGTRGMELAAGAQDWPGLASDYGKSRFALSASRLLDLLIGGAALLFVLPLMIAVAVTIKVQDGGPVLFGHARVGRGGRSFRCWKFRSMVVDAEDRLAALLDSCAESRAEWTADHKLRRDPRVTPFGRLLRVTSLDELPQLLNVLRGDMSLVGPRPIVMSEVGRYGRWFRHYCAVRPGITGLWQVSGRNDVSYRTRVALDVLYARRRTTTLYIGILLATVPAVLRRQGSY
jgi:exopolysaccharide production protein ExoY